MLAFGLSRKIEALRAINLETIDKITNFVQFEKPHKGLRKKINIAEIERV
jgi:hypothetical protein